ncbi:uncharacterized protein [Dendrobates tinctorius]|uniref:uncharacterized protein n=1 Tax=Dendrobates tinctorius TaxID=92724 RepID=UPI003CC9E56C
MKMIIFLVLAGLSLAAGDTDPGSRWQCFFNDLKMVPKVLQEMVKFICTCRGKFDRNVENCKNAFYEMKYTLRDFGCQDDDAFGTAASIEDDAEDAISVAEQAERAFLELTEGLGLNEASTDLLCKLSSGGLLSSKCLGEAIKTNLPAVITALDDTFCKTYKDAELERKVTEFLIKIGCKVDDIAGSKETEQNLVNNLGASLVLQENMDIFKANPNGNLFGVICDMLDGLRGQGGI